MIRKLILAATALSVAATPVVASAAPVAAAQQRTVVKEKRNGTVVVKQTSRARPAPIQYRSNWRKGERFDYRRARNYQVVDYRKYRGLKAPPRGYRYVRSGNDAVLVGITSGLIAAVIAGAIR